MALPSFKLPARSPSDTSGGAVRPNVLYIMADDLNDSVARMGGHPQARTPALERLMSRGVRFTNAQVNVPVCGPSRACTVTGLGPWTTGYYGFNFHRDLWFNNPVMKNSKTFMEAFGDAGYRVFGTGKIMHNRQERMSVWKDGYGHKVDWGPWSWDGKKTTRGGGWPLYSGHQSLPKGWGPGLAMGPLSDVPVVPADPARNVPGYTGWVNNDTTPFRYESEEDRDQMNDEKQALWARDILNRVHDDPFLLCVGIGRPHGPWIAPKKYFDLFPLEEIQLAPQLKNDLRDVPNIIRAKGAYHGFGKYKTLVNGGPDMLKRWTQAYLACVAFADDCIGTILHALDRSPHRDNTLVVFVSDNGYHMGEKFSLFKKSCWEESCRIPMVIAGPGVAENRICKTPVSLIDLFPTFVDRCELNPDPNRSGSRAKLDGHSLSSLLASPEKGTWTGPPVAVSAVNSTRKVKKDHVAPVDDQHWTARSERYRYIRYHDGSEELYDHETDPQEWKNLSRNPAYADVKKRLQTELSEVTGLTLRPAE